MFLSSLSFFSFLISYEFWSRTGFFISYVLTFLLVLEVVRLASTDANRKEVEKMLDAYSASRSETPVRRRSAEGLKKVSLDTLEEMAADKQARTRTPSPAVARTSESERALVKEEKRRRRAISTSQHIASAPAPTQPQPQTQTPPRRLRKRSDTLNSTSSAESKAASIRRRREASPSESKASSRHASPTPRSRSHETKVLGTSLGKMLRSKA
ncbi:hypothetical protein BDW02DRAFT_249448 [Decorospora gaudefroyi]|uniref:Uncharacterized protein n=1 Tax=Decorospora gaudefroyi TaxID=184978 RepID=A0A6A5KDT5_9PLEO|nr:hypothetical protein BDW02DRAFT_249448 [Decorospora gaudefroyi]